MGWEWFLLLAVLLVWLLMRLISRPQRRQGALAKRGGRVSRASVGAHPYHCVAVQARDVACDVVRSVADERFLAAEAPTIPLSGCTEQACRCIYVHFDDRRAIDRRALTTFDTRPPHLRRDMRGEARGRRRGDKLHPLSDGDWRGLQGG